MKKGVLAVHRSNWFTRVKRKWVVVFVAQVTGKAGLECHRNDVKDVMRAGLQLTAAVHMSNFNYPSSCSPPRTHSLLSCSVTLGIQHSQHFIVARCVCLGR